MAEKDHNRKAKENIGKRKIEEKDVSRFNPNSKVLSLQYRKLSVLHEDVGKFEHVTDLYLSGNKLTSLPESICNLTKLKDLYLSDNKLTSLPERLGRLQNLETMVCSRNKLQQLPSSIGAMKKLATLHLGHNDLILLPSEISGLCNLVELNVSGNKLRHLPETIGWLQNLQKLCANCNHLWRLPDSIGLLLNLRVVEIDQNPDLLARLPHNNISLIQASRVKLLRAPWTIEDHFMFGKDSHAFLKMTILCLNRNHERKNWKFIPTELWLKIFGNLCGHDIIPKLSKKKEFMMRRRSAELRRRIPLLTHYKHCASQSFSSTQERNGQIFPIKKFLN